MCEYSIATMDYLPRLGQHLSASLHCRVDGFLIYQSLLLTALSISVLHDGKRRAETSFSKSQFSDATSSTWHRIATDAVPCRTAAARIKPLRLHGLVSSADG